MVGGDNQLSSLPKPVSEVPESVVLERGSRDLVDLIREFLVNVDEIVESGMPRKDVGFVGNASDSVLKWHADHVRISL